MNEVTVGVITYKRPERLKRCLVSILAQKVKPTEVLVVDNDRLGSALPVVKKFCQKLPISYYIEPQQGVSYARNKVLQNVKTELLAFVDDDCILDKHWIENALHSISTNADCSYTVGKSILLNKKDPAAVAQDLRHSYWFYRKLSSDKRTSPFNLDTKNIILRMSHMKEHNLKFDDSCSVGYYDSADTDLGFQFAHAGLTGKYDDRLKVYHEEEPSSVKFLKKMYIKGKIAYLLVKKWKLDRELVHLPYLSWREFLKSFRHAKPEYRRFFKESDLTLKSIYTFLLIKVCDKIFVHGYEAMRSVQHDEDFMPK